MRKSSRHGVIAAGTLAALALVAPSASSAEPAATQLAPLQATHSATAVEGSYIVVLKDQTMKSGRGGKDATKAAADRARGHGAKVRHEYRAALAGYAASMSRSQLDKARRDPAVAYVEADQVVTADTTQANATWGLDRIDQRNLPLNGTYTYTPTGAGVKAYIIDTGILTSHSQFTGRTAAGYSAVNDGRGTTDCNGHGTHVAGSVGGSTYGVAKGVTLVPVRVLGCDGSGTNSGVIAGMDWVTQNHSGASVANMSLGGGASTATDDAVSRMTSSGVTVAVAAGNDNANACNYSPARAASAITVGSTTNTDARSSFSNYGSCLDAFAPGSNITSAWHTSTAATNTISGTSMASPHVAGVAALYLQGSPSASPSTVASAIVNTSTTGMLTGIGTGSPNRLAYSLLTGGTTPPPTTECTSTTTGSLGYSGDYDVYASYTSSTSGVHSGCLTGPSGTDFDLYLQKYSGSAWSTVARSEGLTSTETIRYSGTSGTYRWIVQSYSGYGSYTLKTGRP